MTTPTMAQVAEAMDMPMEALPDDLQARIETQERHLRERLARDAADAIGPQFVIEFGKKWTPGQKVTVAFNGGGNELHREIADTAMDWLQGGIRLQLDFGRDPTTGACRTWSATDREYKADIRISFNETGYWSLVGTDSNNPSIIRPSRASMNLAGFDRGKPHDWKAVVLHEFGHALGFHHEHQHPSGGCDTEFRWEDDSKYAPTENENGTFLNDPEGRRPGLYTVLSGYPNYWPKTKVDFNLRQLPRSNAFVSGPYDAASIMKYSFPDWMFRRGTASHCFTPRNAQLSAGDREGIAMIYGKDDATEQKIIAQRREVLRQLSAAASFAPEMKQ